MSDNAPFDVPQWIFALKAAMVTFDVAAFLDGGLSLSDGDVLETEVVGFE